MGVKDITTVSPAAGGKLLLNFAQMAVFRYSVGMKTLIALVEQQRN